MAYTTPMVFRALSADLHRYEMIKQQKNKAANDQRAILPDINQRSEAVSLPKTESRTPAKGFFQQLKDSILG